MSSTNNNIGGIVRGGGSSMVFLQLFLATIIIGYFGIKIVYGSFFGYYPEKYYYRNLELKTQAIGEDSSGLDVSKCGDYCNELSNSDVSGLVNDQTFLDRIVLKSFLPGLWNTEITDFIILIVLSSLIFLFTNVNSRKLFSESGGVDSVFIIGYILGLLFPLTYFNVKRTCNTSRICCENQNLTLVIVSILIIILAIYSNSKSQSQNTISSSLAYILCIIFIVFGLYFARKESFTFTNVQYTQSVNSCEDKKSGSKLFSSGDQLLLTPGFTAWILLFLLSSDPQIPMLKQVIYFIYGLLLGIFVSSISYYGFEYFLMKLPERMANNIGDVEFKTPNISFLTDLFNTETVGDISGYSGITESKSLFNGGNLSAKQIKNLLVVVFIGLVLYLGYSFVRK